MKTVRPSSKLSDPIFNIDRQYIRQIGTDQVRNPAGKKSGSTADLTISGRAEVSDSPFSLSRSSSSVIPPIGQKCNEPPANHSVAPVHPQNVRFQNVRFQNVWFQNVRFQNVRFTKRQVYKTSGFKTSGFKTSSF
jgi:hypothetical protein